MPIVYKITNIETNKVYIGWSNKTLEKRWAEHVSASVRCTKNRKFYNAIKKYGIDAWTKEVICETETKQEAKSTEIFYIALFDSYINGYNSTKGGDGNNGIIMSAESNLARSLALKGKSKSPETVAKFRSRKQTTEAKNAISQSHLGMSKPWVKWSKEQIEKRALTRRSLSLEQYDNIHSLRKQGLTIKQISGDTGISTDLVKKWLKKPWKVEHGTQSHRSKPLVSA